ncbi:MAG: FtsX-like permease family protein [Nitrospirae bacterium]|nr:FtsX-like permease family protein [Nitrospirota bacterium]MBI3351038.1 FtsX-like permease family protein [Nitrospirota bacterium]
MKKLLFIFKMAKREILTSWRHFIFFLFCVALGVGSIVGIGSISDQIEYSVFKEAKGLLGGDIEIDLNHALSPEGLSAIQKLETRGIKHILVQEMIAMASNPRDSTPQLVELKAVGAEYPFYGTLTLDPPAGPNPFAQSHMAWVEESLVIKLGMRVGEEIKLGDIQLKIAGVIKKEPDRMTEAFSLGPRVMISERDLKVSGLVQPGSRVRYRYLLQVPPDRSIPQTLLELKTSLADERATIESYTDAQPRLRRFLNNLTVYLGFIGLISLFIGGIGVGNSIHAYLKEKTQTMGILKCLGTPSSALFYIYFLQTLVMGLLGSLFGVGIGLFLHKIFQGLLKTILPQSLTYFFPTIAVLKGMIAGTLVVLLFSLIPLFRIKTLSPNRILKRDILASSLGKIGFRQGMAIGAVSLGILAFIYWQSGSLRVGATFTGIFLGALILLKFSAWAVLRWIKNLKPASFALRYGMANLNRPGQFAQSVILSIGLGITVICAVLIIGTGLFQQVSDNIPVNAPTFFFIDIQKSQKEAFEALLVRRSRQMGFKDTHEMVPIVRSRLQAVGSIPVKELKNNEAWYFQREYVLTSQKEPPYENKIVKGAWWSPGTESGTNKISIEEDLAKHLGVGLGASLTFDIQGTPVQGTITSIRSVNWENLRTNFFIIFSPGAFQEIPMSYIATSQSRPELDLEFQREVVSGFPNVTAVNIRHVLNSLKEIMGKILLAVEFMGGFAVIAGLIVLAGSVAATRYFRLKESVILKILGAVRSKIAGIFVSEYTLLGTIAGVIGMMMGTLLAWVFLKFIMEIKWRFPVLGVLALFVSTVVLTILISFLMIYRMIGKKPLAVLRQN